MGCRHSRARDDADGHSRSLRSWPSDCIAPRRVRRRLGHADADLVHQPGPEPSRGFQGAFGQAGIAERCSTDEYTVETELLPQSATEQRVQLLRRLVAEDSSITLMSLDPVFTAEFAAADFLAPIPDDVARELTRGTLKGAIEGATWDDELVVAPLWANTQVLWFRKSLTEKAGLDMTKPVTWDQVIDAAADNDSTRRRSGQQLRGLRRLDQRPGRGRRRQHRDRHPGRPRRVGRHRQEPGAKAAEVIQKLASSPAAQPDLSVSNEGTVLGPLGSDQGGFMVNWTFAYNNYKADEKVLDDLGWARYPQTVQGEQSRPPIGGINVGISKFGKNQDLAAKAVQCITSEAEQVTYAIDTANMPAREAAYENAEAEGAVPRRPADAVAHEHRQRRAAPAVGLLGHDRQRDPRPVAPGELGQPGHAPRNRLRRSSSRRSRARCCSRGR